MTTNPGPTTPSRGGCANGCLVSLIFLILSPILLFLFSLALGGILIVADPLVESDAVIVLSGSDDDSRIEEGARLQKDKQADLVILTEINTPDSEFTYIQLAKESLWALGIPDSFILVTEKPAESTYEEAQQIKRLMKEKAMKSAIVVTDPFHTFRTRMIFEDVFRGSGIEIHVRPVRNHWYRSNTWFLTETGRQMTFNEVLKIFAYLAGFR